MVDQIFPEQYTKISPNIRCTVKENQSNKQEIQETLKLELTIESKLQMTSFTALKYSLQELGIIFDDIDVFILNQEDKVIQLKENQQTTEEEFNIKYKQIQTINLKVSQINVLAILIRQQDQKNEINDLKHEIKDLKHDFNVQQQEINELKHDVKQLNEFMQRLLPIKEKLQESG